MNAEDYKNIIRQLAEIILDEYPKDDFRHALAVKALEKLKDQSATPTDMLNGANAEIRLLRAKMKAAEARILELNRELDAEIAEKTARLIEESNRADAAEARLRAVADALLEDVTSQQGGAK